MKEKMLADILLENNAKKSELLKKRFGVDLNKVCVRRKAWFDFKGTVGKIEFNRN